MNDELGNVNNWNNEEYEKTRLEELFWLIDKRLFRWDNLPGLAKVKFVQKSYLFLLIIPLADQFLSPLFSLPSQARLELDLGWIYILPEGLKISFELGMPFSWSLIYFLVLSLGVGSVVYEIFVPRVIGRENRGTVTRQLVLQNFREVANGIYSAKRANHFLSDFATRYISNVDKLKTPPKQHTGPKIIPLQEGDSELRVDKYSVYYHAEFMELIPEKLEDALETIVWFQNETRLFARWFCGSLFLISISLFMVLIWQGLLRML